MRTSFTRWDHITSLIRMVRGKKMQMLTILVVTIATASPNLTTASPNLATDLEAVRAHDHTATDHEDITDWAGPGTNLPRTHSITSGNLPQENWALGPWTAGPRTVWPWIVGPRGPIYHQVAEPETELVCDSALAKKCMADIAGWFIIGIYKSVTRLIISIQEDCDQENHAFCPLAYQEACSGMTTISGFYRSFFPHLCLHFQIFICIANQIFHIGVCILSTAIALPILS